MTHTYNIAGMTCNKCVAKVKSELLKLGDVTEALVQLTPPQATISMQKHIPAEALQQVVSKAGPYSIAAADGGMQHTTQTAASTTWFETYKPVLLIFIYITVIAFINASTAGSINGVVWMNTFMSGFFLVFSFFKLLNITAFADSYSMYDIVAKRFKPWAFIYPFIELALGLSYAVNFNPVVTNAVALVVMSTSLAGVLQSVFNKRKIQCACLGVVFNLPMSTVTIIEDAAMVAMSGIMLVTIL